MRPSFGALGRREEGRFACFIRRVLHVTLCLCVDENGFAGAGRPSGTLQVARKVVVEALAQPSWSHGGQWAVIGCRRAQQNNHPNTER